MIGNRERWSGLVHGLRAGDPAETDRPMVDIGSSVLTGVRDRRDPATRSATDVVGHPVAHTRVLSIAAARAVRSDFVRTGFVHALPELDDEGCFVDPLGVRWMWSDGEPAPLSHPLAVVDDAGIRLAPPLPRPGLLVGPGADRDLMVVADAPGPGLLECCFAERGQWRFLEDVSECDLAVAALLDRALVASVASYESMLGALPGPPDLVVYADDLGWADSMYLTSAEFRALVLPRLRELLGRIRELTPAPIALSAAGAIGPILADLAGLGVEVLNLQHDARGMDPAGLRRSLPAATVLHGVTDLVELGRAIAVHDLAFVANAAYQFARCWPVVAAPVGSLDIAELPDAVTAAAFLSALGGDDVALIRRAGPVKSVVTRCLAVAAPVAVDLGAVTLDRPLDVSPVTSS